MKLPSWIESLVYSGTLLCAASVGAQDIVAPDARVESLGRVAFTEGPAWHPDGSVYFSDIENNRIMRLSPDGLLNVFRTPSGKANGLLFDHQGRLIACEGGNRWVTRTESDGTIRVLANRYEGKKFNSPNDVTIDSQGYLYFTDPRYGDRSNLELFDADGKSIEGVYRIDPDGKVTRILTHEIERPNGIAVSPDDKHLFVAVNTNDDQGNSRSLWRFELNGDRDIVAGSQKKLFDWGTDRGPDGMAIDQQSRLVRDRGIQLRRTAASDCQQIQGGRLRLFAGRTTVANDSRADRHDHQLRLWRRGSQDAVHHRRAQAVEHSRQSPGAYRMAKVTNVTGKL